MRTLRIYSSNNLPVYLTAVLAIVILLYITPLVVIYFISGSLYFFDHLPTISLPHPMPLITTSLICFSMNLFFAGVCLFL